METKSRTPLYILLGLVGVVVLAAAAFLAGRLMTRQTGAGGPQVFGGGEGGPEVMAMEVNMKPAPELPQTSPEVNGLFTRRDDNSIFLGTFSGGGMGMSVGGVMSEGPVPDGKDGEESEEGPVLSAPKPDGPEVEVVITAETKIYRETTQMDPSSPPEGEIQQTVEPGDLDELDSQSMLVVWGRRTGDRVVADVVLVSQPMVFVAPAGR